MLYAEIAQVVERNETIIEVVGAVPTLRSKY